jgi:hypothetical protein
LVDEREELRIRISIADERGEETSKLHSKLRAVEGKLHELIAAPAPPKKPRRRPGEGAGQRPQ